MIVCGGSDFGELNPWNRVSNIFTERYVKHFSEIYLQ